MRSTDRNTTLDTIRGLAACGVVIFHLPAIAVGGPIDVSWWMAPLLIIGDTGVQVFFVLSAFLLTILMPKYNRHSFPVLSFYIKRVLRIAPLFYCAFIFWAVYRFLNTGSFIIPPAVNIFTSGTLLFNLIPSQAHSVVFAGWTIGVEVLFYLIFPLIFHRLTTVPVLIASLLISFSVSVIFNQILPHYLDDKLANIWSLIGFLRHLPTFIMGMLLAKVYLYCDGRDNRQIGFILLALSAFLYTALLSNMLPNVLIDVRQWRGVAAALFVSGFIFAPIHIWPSFTSFLGRISYSIYLMHGIVIKSLGGIFVAIASSGLYEGLWLITIILIAFAAIIPVSWLTYRIIELPGIRLSNRIVGVLDQFGSWRLSRSVRATT